MKILDRNALGIVFVIDEGRLIGSLSDGDIRRAIISGAKTFENVAKYCNKNVFSMPIGTPEKIQKSLSKK